MTYSLKTQPQIKVENSKFAFTVVHTCKMTSYKGGQYKNRAKNLHTTYMNANSLKQDLMF